MPLVTTETVMAEVQRRFDEFTSASDANAEAKNIAYIKVRATLDTLYQLKLLNDDQLVECHKKWDQINGDAKAI